MFKKILIANRGEIAVRIARACREMGIASAAVFSDADRAALHVRLADEAYAVGPAPSRESYLRIDKLMDVARRAGCDALHPGYGFLAENPELRAGLRRKRHHVHRPFPRSDGAPGIENRRAPTCRAGRRSHGSRRKNPIENLEDAEHIAHELGYPVLLKAVAGGGGKGMRIVAAPDEMAAAWRDAASEALNAFGDAASISKSILIARAISKFRFLATRTATSCISASANAPSSGGIRK